MLIVEGKEVRNCEPFENVVVNLGFLPILEDYILKSIHYIVKKFDCFVTDTIESNTDYVGNLYWLHLK